MKAEIPRERLVQLSETIRRRFDREGLRDLCFVVGVFVHRLLLEWFAGQHPSAQM